MHRRRYSAGVGLSEYVANGTVEHRGYAARIEQRGCPLFGRQGRSNHGGLPLCLATRRQLHTTAVQPRLTQTTNRTGGQLKVDKADKKLFQKSLWSSFALFCPDEMESSGMK